MAVVFCSRSTGTGYERIGGTVADGRITAKVRQFGTCFVANGVDYTDPPDPSCVVTRLVEGRTFSPSTVALFFSADDCDFRPITGLKAADFVVKEDGEDLSVEATASISQRPGVEVFISLVLDMSQSTSGAVRTQLISGAKAFVTTLMRRGVRVHASVELFAGQSGLTEWQSPTLLSDQVLAKLDALVTYQPADPASTNLYGALITSLSRLAAAERSLRDRNYGGAFTNGYVVVFTDGRDTAGQASFGQAFDATRASRDQVLAVALEGPEYTSAAKQALKDLAPFGVFTASDGSQLQREFSALANRIAGQIIRTYLLGYCSPARSRNHTVTVEVKRPAPVKQSSDAFIGPGGGIVVLGKAHLDVPPGALAAPEIITLTSQGVPPPQGFRVFSEVYRLDPVSVVLQAPVTLTLPFTGNATVATMFCGPTGGPFQKVEGEVQDDGVLGTVPAFGTCFVADGQAYFAQATASYVFSADGFGPGCTADFEQICASKECGGLGCGACDDRTSSCDPGSSGCVALTPTATPTITPTSSPTSTLTFTPRTTCAGQIDGTTCGVGMGSPFTMTCSNGTCGFCTPNLGPSAAFLDNGDGTIIDPVRCLVWEKKDNAGGIHDLNGRRTWSDGNFLGELNGGFAGYHDWRLPLKNELDALLNFQNCSPCVSVAFNTNCGSRGDGNPGCTVDAAEAASRCSCTASDLYWSDTICSPTDAAAVEFSNNRGYNYFQCDNVYQTYHYVRAIRGGLVPTPTATPTPITSSLTPTPSVPGSTPAVVCGEEFEGQVLTLTCPTSIITAIDFVSYGTPGGTCSAFELGACSADMAISRNIVATVCVGRASCSVDASNSVFGDPCFGTPKQLFVQARCG